MRLSIPITLACALCLGFRVYGSEELSQKMWDMKMLSKAPKTHPAPEYGPKGEKAMFIDGILNTPELRQKAIDGCSVRSLFYDGLPYKGKPTRVFAYYGVPRTTDKAKFPAMVLVHGGGGTAFESWVRLWNTRGYAAIAIDTCGRVPEGSYGAWNRLESGGPAGWGGFDQIDEPVHDQWSYHAIADIILAHSLLRSFKEVDPNRIGITGISWGGYLTCIAAGVDNRFKFAVPVYGCGFLGDNSAWLDTFTGMKEKSKVWLAKWDPSVYLPEASMPMLWITGTNDFAYPMDSLQKSYRLPRGPHTLCISPQMQHGHGGLGENPEEIHAFADSMCNGENPLIKIKNQGINGKKIWATYSSQTPVDKAELIYTCDIGKWQDRNWESAPAAMDASQVTADIPNNAQVCYINLTDSRGLTVSTEHELVSKTETTAQP